MVGSFTFFEFEGHILCDTLFIDGNGKLGSITDDHVGSGGFPQREDNNGASFHKVLVDCGLGAPSMFVEQHPDHGTHSGNRVDCFDIPLNQKDAVTMSTTLRDFGPFVKKTTIIGLL